MNIPELIVLIAAGILTVSWVVGIRRFVSTGKGITHQTVNTAMMFTLSIIYVISSNQSPFNLFWLVPISWFLGTLSLAFPLSLLWIPGSIFARIVTVGINQKIENDNSGDLTHTSEKEALKKKSHLVMVVINEVTKMSFEAIASELESYDVDNKKADEIWRILASMTLFQAQRFYWSRLIENKKIALEFEQGLYESFAESFKFNAKPFIREMAEYVKQGDPSREIQYVGSSVTKIIGVKDAMLMLSLSQAYFSFIDKSFNESLKKAFEYEVPSDSE